jgi:hypothetical protein
MPKQFTVAGKGTPQRNTGCCKGNGAPSDNEYACNIRVLCRTTERTVEMRILNNTENGPTSIFQA